MSPENFAHTNASRDMVAMLLAYRAWADQFVYDALAEIPTEELFRMRPTTFGNIIMTANHVYVVDDIFRHHLEGRPHPYHFRNTDDVPTLSALRSRVKDLNDWYAKSMASWSDDQLNEVIQFEFVGGGAGAMTRAEIILHIVNHGTYHRGFIGDMLRQIPFVWGANDLTIFLRDVWQQRA
jgi:uncharacterized damage-inducible protein DinB